MAGFTERVRERWMGSRASTDQNKFSNEASENMNPAEVADLLLRIFKAVVDNPDKVRITHAQGERTHVFTVFADKSDIGKVIGKQGRMVGSVRTILMGVATKGRARAVLEVEDGNP